MKNYIVDFVLTNESFGGKEKAKEKEKSNNKNNIWVVELNPYGESTGSGLFDYKKDKKLLEEGPLELRVNEKESAGPAPEWVTLMELAEKPVTLNELAEKPKKGTGSGKESTTDKSCVMM